MSTISPLSLTLLKQHMEYCAKQQRVLAENVSHANEPGYKAKMLEPFEKVLARSRGRQTNTLGLTCTSPVHIYAEAKAGRYKLRTLEDAYESNPNGNTVNLEQQALLMSEASDHYKQSVQVYKKLQGLLRSVLGGR
jgi:flagellar basal-body rod protein FlgB